MQFALGTWGPGHDIRIKLRGFIFEVYDACEPGCLHIVEASDLGSGFHHSVWGEIRTRAGEPSLFANIESNLLFHGLGFRDFGHMYIESNDKSSPLLF